MSNTGYPNSVYEYIPGSKRNICRQSKRGADQDL